VNIYHATGIIVKQINATDKRLTKPQSIKNRTQKGPIESVEWLFLMQGKQSSRNPRRGTKINNITKETTVSLIKRPGTLQV